MSKQTALHKRMETLDEQEKRLKSVQADLEAALVMIHHVHDQIRVFKPLNYKLSEGHWNKWRLDSQNAYHKLRTALEALTKYDGKQEETPQEE